MTLVRDVQPENALSSMVVRLRGNVMDDSEVQPLNIELERVVRELGIETLVRAVQFSNK